MITGIEEILQKEKPRLRLSSMVILTQHFAGAVAAAKLHFLWCKKKVLRSFNKMMPEELTDNERP